MTDEVTSSLEQFHALSNMIGPVKLRDVLSTIFRHRRKMIATFVACMVLTVAGLTAMPRTYESEAKLFIRLGRGSLSLDPTVTTGQVVHFQKLEEDEVNSALEMLNSRELLQRVVDALGPTAILTPSEEASPGDRVSDARATMGMVKATLSSSADTLLTGIGLKDPISDRELAIRKLSQNLRASAARRSSVVTLTCTAASPAAAQRLVATATEIFRQHHASSTETAGSHEFFTEQSQLLHDELAQASELLRDRKTAYGMLDVKGAQEKLLAEISRTETATLETDRELSFTTARLDTLQEQLQSLPEKIVSGTTTGSNVARDGMQQQLFDLQKQEQDLLARLTPQHPLIAHIRAQRAEMERILEQQAPQREALTETPNPLRKDLEGELLRSRATIDALMKRRSVLGEQRAELERQSALLNEREVEVAELARNVLHLEGQYKAHVDHLEQARIGKALQDERISSINIIQPATLVERPIRPSKSLTLAAGFVLAMVSTFGIAFGLEFIDPTFRTREQVEEALGLPVVASLAAEGRRRAGVSSTLGAVNSSFARAPGGMSYQVLAGRLSDFKSATPNSGKRQAVTVAIVNCQGERRGSVAAELALSATQVSDGPVLLVDADTARRHAGDHFGANGAAGLADVLRGKAGLEDCVRASGFHNLSLLSSGSVQPNGTEVDLRHVRRHLQPLTEQYGLMIADLPTSEAHGTEVLAARGFDVVLLVVEAERTRVEDVRNMQRQLAEGGANVLGCILQGEREYLPRWLRHYV